METKTLGRLHRSRPGHLPEESGIDEAEWIQAASANLSLDFLKDPEEDIYTLSGGRPFHDMC